MPIILQFFIFTKIIKRFLIASELSIYKLVFYELIMMLIIDSLLNSVIWCAADYYYLNVLQTLLEMLSAVVSSFIGFYKPRLFIYEVILDQ